MARGQVLSGSRRVELEAWPGRSEVLIQFEQSAPELDHLLSADCLVRPGPIWLFEYEAVGFAREVKGKRVKPGRKYIVVHSDHRAVDSEWIAPIRLKPRGVRGAVLSVPAPVGSDFMPVADALGLAVSTAIEVWPLGLSPASWDGTGRAEWRTTDTPRIGIRANIEIEGVSIAIDGVGVTSELRALGRDESCFIELPVMEVGTYRLSVLAGSSGTRPSELGTLELVIREPRPWAPATDESSPLMVISDPRTPTLEDVWEGNATFHVYAPASRTVECWLSLYESRANIPFSETKLQMFAPPLEPSSWHRTISGHFAEWSDAQEAFDRASRCQIEVRAEDLGTFRLECERAATPVRWAAKRVGRDGYRLRVVDDRGSGLELDLKYFSFSKPEIGQALDVATHVATTAAAGSGGLYVAEWGRERQAVIVPNSIRSLQDLAVDPQVRPGTRSKRRALEILRRLRTWQSAGLRGDLTALTGRNRVLGTLIAALVDVIGNPGWMEAERAFERSRDSRSIARLERFVATDPSRDLYGMMRDQCEKLDGNRRQLRFDCIAGLGARVFRSDSGWRARRELTPRQPPSFEGAYWLAEFTFRLVSAPHSLQDWAHPSFEYGLDELFRQPKLLPAARFAVLVAHRELTQEPLDPDVLYTGWDWE